MNQLLKIENHNGQSVVSARELHSFLESKREFATWVKDRINKYGFVENEDFTVFDEIVKNSNGGRPLKEYALTIDTAKELAMVEGNEKGKQARQYFIECERKAKNPIASLSRLDIAKMLLESETEKQKLLEENAQKEAELELANKTILEQAPAAKYTMQVLSSPDLIPTRIISKDLGMSPNALNNILHKKGIQFKQGETWVLYSKYQDRGYTKTRTHTFYDKSGEARTAIHTYWTERGRAFIHNLLNPLKKAN